MSLHIASLCIHDENQSIHNVQNLKNFLEDDSHKNLLFSVPIFFL